MKTAFVTKIMMLLMAVSFAGLFGCNEEKTDNSGLILSLAAAGSTPWTVVNPPSNSRNVPYNTNIVLRYEGGNLNQKITTWDVTLHDGDSLFSMTDGTSTLAFDGDEVTVDPTAMGFSDGVTYSKMDITGFKDEAGIEIESCRLSTYNFTVEPK